MHARWQVAVAAALVLCGLLATSALTECGRGPGAEAVPSPNPEPPAVQPTGPFRLVAIGDFGTGGADEGAIAAAVDRWTDRFPINALLTTGDNVYESGNPADFAAAWTGPYGWVGDEHVPVIAALGNHDIETAAGAPVMGLLGMPSAWYARRIGPAQLIVLDANDPTDPDQLAFLRQTLAASTARWEIAIFHQPAYSCSHHGSTPAVDAAWLPLLEGGGVDLVLNGHDHTYERFGPLHGTTYVVTGGGGAPLYPDHVCPPGTPAPRVDRVVHHFVTLTFSGSTLRVEALDPAFHVVDRFSLTAAGGSS
jgi:3',5'-cyclic AMP phosphodiesterase CpdA